MGRDLTSPDGFAVRRRVPSVGQLGAGFRALADAAVTGWWSQRAQRRAGCETPGCLCPTP